MMGERFRKERRILAVDCALRLLHTAMKEGKSVVLDECNLHGASFGIFIARAQQMGARIEWHNMNVSVEECKKRNAELGHPVSDFLIDRYAEKYSIWLES